MNIQFWIALALAFYCTDHVNGQKIESTKIDCNETQMLYPTKLIPDADSKSGEKTDNYKCIDVFDKDMETTSPIKCVCGWYDKCSDRVKNTSETLYIGGIDFRPQIAAFDYLLENCKKGNKKDMVEYVNDGKNVTVLTNIRNPKQVEYTICTGAIRESYFCYPDDHYPDTVGEDAAWVTGLVLGVVLPLAICKPQYTACVATDNCCAKADGSAGECLTNAETTPADLCNVGADGEACATPGSTSECQTDLVCSTDPVCAAGCLAEHDLDGTISITYGGGSTAIPFASGTTATLNCGDDTKYLSDGTNALATGTGNFVGGTCTAAAWSDTGVGYTCADCLAQHAECTDSAACCVTSGGQCLTNAVGTDSCDPLANGVACAADSECLAALACSTAGSCSDSCKTAHGAAAIPAPFAVTYGGGSTAIPFASGTTTTLNCNDATTFLSDGTDAVATGTGDFTGGTCTGAAWTDAAKTYTCNTCLAQHAECTDSAACCVTSGGQCLTNAVGTDSCDPLANGVSSCAADSECLAALACSTAGSCSDSCKTAHGAAGILAPFTVTYVGGSTAIPFDAGTATTLNCGDPAMYLSDGTGAVATGTEDFTGGTCTGAAWTDAAKTYACNACLAAAADCTIANPLECCSGSCAGTTPVCG